MTEYAAGKIKPLLPSLTAVKGAQRNGGIYFRELTPEEETLPSPKIFLIDEEFTSNETRKIDDDAHQQPRQERLVRSVDELIQTASLAHFGNGEKTEIDLKVRKTLSIPPSRCRVEWNPHLSHAVAEFGRDVLHLSDSQVHHLSAELHNVLVYREGDFFAPHRDSYKKEGHIGTLSVLVSDFPGDINDNSDNHGDDSYVDRTTTAGSASVVEGGSVYFAVGTELRTWDATPRSPWAGWIGSVRHAVTKVTRGRRVVAVYNLIFDVATPSTCCTASSSSPTTTAAGGVCGRSKPATTTGVTRVKSKSSLADTTYMPGKSLAKMPIALFHRLVEAPHLTSIEDAKNLRLVCHSLNDHIGGIVGCISKQFIAADKVARSVVERTLKPNFRISNLPLILPLRNSYSTGGSRTGLVPPQHLFGQDLFLYEAAAMALGRHRIAICPISLMLERNTERRNLDESVRGNICIARDIVIPNEVFDSPKKTAKWLGDLGWRLIHNETDGDVAVHPQVFPPNCISWGAKRLLIRNWKKPRSHGMAAAAEKLERERRREERKARGEDADDDDDASSDDTSSEDYSRDDNEGGDKALMKGEGDHINDLAQDIHDAAPCEDSDLDNDFTYYDDSPQDVPVFDSDRDEDGSIKSCYDAEYLCQPYHPPVVEPSHEEIPSANRHLHPRRSFEKTRDEIVTELEKRNCSLTTIQYSIDEAAASRKIMNDDKWMLRQANLRRDPLRKLKPEGYTSSIWGNMSTFRLFFFRRCALVIVLGDNNDEGDGDGTKIDFETLLGPPVEATFPDEVPCHVVQGEEECYQY